MAISFTSRSISAVAVLILYSRLKLHSANAVAGHERSTRKLIKTLGKIKSIEKIVHFIQQLWRCQSDLCVSCSWLHQRLINQSSQKSSEKRSAHNLKAASGTELQRVPKTSRHQIDISSVQRQKVLQLASRWSTASHMWNSLIRDSDIKAVRDMDLVVDSDRKNVAVSDALGSLTHLPCSLSAICVDFHGTVSAAQLK